MRLYHDQPSGTVTRARLLRGLREAFPVAKWRHQVPVGPFYADILCFAERLAIEVDGDSHAGNETKDARRTAFVEQEGYRVIRFANADIILDGIPTQISFFLREREEARAPQKRGKDEGNAGYGKGDAR